jgi:succinate dehydrogenase/fumarate reductase flavoprotein subunit
MTAGGEQWQADVVVVGGGPAGAWAALQARANGAERAVLVDKGACGTSGATASANTGVWFVPPDPAARAEAIATRQAQSGGLGREELMEAVLETTYRQLDQLGAWGFPFPTDDDGQPYRANLRGPDYMAFLRQRLKRAGVTLLDHSPAQELLLHDAAVAGVAGYRLQQDVAYSVRAGAVVLASGGVAFLSKTLGCDVNTGDGLLMAAEAGAELSGMEFSAQYGICPAYSSVTKGLPYFWATFSDESGRVLDMGNNRMLGVARALLEGPVYAVLDQANPDVQRWLRDGQPNCFLPHDRLGVDPFRQRFPITLRCEGTVRGTGGIRLAADDGSTRVPGLYAAGDAASREGLTGSATGGGAPNAAWAISSGSWAGRAAAQFAGRTARPSDDRSLHAAGLAGLRPSSDGPRTEAAELVRLVQGEALPIRKNLFRTGEQLTASLLELDAGWSVARASLQARGRGSVRAREAAALLASARWAYRSALGRAESRGLHRRIDRPALDPEQTHHLIAEGLDEIRIRAYPHRASPHDRAAE